MRYAIDVTIDKHLHSERNDTFHDIDATDPVDAILALVRDIDPDLDETGELDEPGNTSIIFDNPYRPTEPTDTIRAILARWALDPHPPGSLILEFGETFYHVESIQPEDSRPCGACNGTGRITTGAGTPNEGR